MTIRTSNGVPFLVLEAEPSIRTGIRIDIYDGANPNTLLAVLPDTFGRKWRDALVGPGSGTFKVFTDNEILVANPGLLDYGNIARFVLDEVDRFAITIEAKDGINVVSRRGDVERAMTVSGRGVLAKLEEAQTYLSGGLTGDVERPFTVNAGQAIRFLIAEAQARGGLTAITTNFTDTDDSNNAPFEVPLDLTERAGTDLLRVSERHGSAYVDVHMTPGLVLEYFNSRGINRSIQLPDIGPVVLQVADNIAEMDYSEKGSIRNALLVETPTGWLERVEGASITEHRRREAFLSLGNVSSGDAVDRATDAVFQRSAQPAAHPTLTVVDKEGQRPYVEWNVGDLVLAPDSDSALTAQRVRVLNVSENAKGEPQFQPEVSTLTDELEERLERWMSAMSRGTLGGSASDVAEPVRASIEVVTAVDSGIDDHKAIDPHHDEFGDLSDVDLTGLLDRDGVVYDQASGSWLPIGRDLDDLEDVDVAGAPDGRILKKVAGVWVDAVEAGGGGYGAKLFVVADDVPASPDSDDDEFDDESITGWTEQHAGSAATWTERADSLLYVEAAAESGWAVKTQHKTLPGSGDWEYQLGVAVATIFGSNYIRPINLCLIEGSTAQGVYIFGQVWDTNPTLSVIRLNSYSAWNSTISAADLMHAWPHYLRVEKSGTTYSFKYSTDGQAFTTLWSGSVAFVPASIAIGLNVENATYPAGGAVKHFRRIS